MGSAAAGGQAPGSLTTDGAWVWGRVDREGVWSVVGAVTNAAVTARGRTQRRAAVQQAGRAERDTRIEAAAAQVTAARDTIRGNAERRALAVAAAQQAITTAERVERDANAAADEQILAAVRQLRADGMTVAGIEELLHLSVPRVRQLIKRSHAPGNAGTPGATPGTAGRGAG